MTATIKHDMYNKIKNAKEIASKALGQVDLASKVLRAPEVAKAKLDVETEITGNASTSESAQCAPEVKGKLLSQLVPKKVDAKTEETAAEAPSVDECQEVKKIPDDTTKAMKAKAIVKAKKVDATETELK